MSKAKRKSNTSRVNKYPGGMTTSKQRRRLTHKSKTGWMKGRAKRYNGRNFWGAG